MKYRTRLYLFFLINGILIMAISMIFIQYLTQKALFGELQGKVIAIAATTAVGINGDKVKKIQTVEDQKSPEYLETQSVLRRARDVNRKGDVFIKYLYITRPEPNDPKKFVFVVDPEEDPQNFSPVGQENPAATTQKLYDHLMEGYSFPATVKDPWGEWLTGNYPILDSQGKYVGSVGADMDAHLVRKSLNRVYYFLGISFFSTLLFGFIASMLLSRSASKAIEALAAATLEIGKGNYAYRVDLKRDDEFQKLADSFNQMIQGLEEKESMKSGFSHYVSPHVLEEITKWKGITMLQGEKRKITVFFSDIRGFTHISEEMKPEDVVSLLNEYFEAMLEVIFKYNGTLDKLLGDGIMAEFGAPLDDNEQERNAVLTAIEMNQKIAILGEKWKSEGKPLLAIGVGIHTGEAIVGSLGSRQRMEYTAIGDTVNVASRLEHYSRECDYPIIISESTYEKVKDEFKCFPLGPVTLAGRGKPIIAYGIKP